MVRWQLRIAIGMIGMLLCGLAAYNYCKVYLAAPIQLSVSGGNVSPWRSQMAEHLSNEFYEGGLSLNRLAKTNSESIYDAVDDHELDLGIVLAGFSPESHPNVRQVASLGIDPLHLLVRSELLKSASTSLEILRGKRVTLGEPGTNCEMLAKSLMQFASLTPSSDTQDGDFTSEKLSEEQLLWQLQTIEAAPASQRHLLIAKLPDAVFLVCSVPSETADQLVTIAGYQFVPLPYSDALHLDNHREHKHVTGRLDSNQFDDAMIPAFAYGINPAAPVNDCPTVGLRLLLIAHKDTPARGIVRLLRSLDDRIAKRHNIEFDASNEQHNFPIHPGAEEFVKGRRPLSLGELIEPIGNVFSVVGAAAAGGLGLWGFFRGLRKVKPDVHLVQIDRIERLLRGDEQMDGAPLVHVDFIDFLERRLAEIKKAAIEDYANGRLEHGEALVSILTLIADTRHILVQRRQQTGELASRERDHSNLGISSLKSSSRSAA